MEPYRPQLSFDLELPLMQTAEEICPFMETRQQDEEEEEEDEEEEEEEEEEEVENPSDMVHPSVSNNAPLQVERKVEGEAGGGGAIVATQQADRNSPSKFGHGLVLQPLPVSNPPPHHELSDEGVYPVRHASHGAVVQDKGLFIEALRSFLPAVGVRLIIPRLGGQELDLHSLYKEVTCRGGLEQVTKYKKWKEITSSLDILHSSRNASFVLRKHYINLLYHFEQSYYFGVQGRLVPPPAPLPAPCSTESNACKIPDGDSTAIKRKRKMDFNGIFEADPVVSIGNTVSGAINGKVEEGYMVTVVIGGERMSGCMYVVPCDTIPEQYATVPGLLGGASSKKVEVRGGEKVQTPPKIRRVHRKDTDIPKNTRSGYNLFCRELRAKRKLMPRGRSNEPRKSVYELWRRLPEEEKIVYRERGNGEREKQKKESKEKTDLESRKGEAILSIMPESDSAYDYHVSLDAVTAPLEHNMNEEGCLNENLSQEQASDSENSHQEYQNDEPLSEVDADGGSPQASDAEDGENAYHVKIPSPTMEENMGVINNTHYTAGPNYAYPSQMHPSHLTGALVGTDHDMRYEAPENGRTYRSPLPILHNAHNSSMIPPEQMYYAQNGFVHAAKAHCEQGPALSQQGYRPQGSWLPHGPAYGPNHISNEEMYRPHGGGGIPQGGGGIPQGGGGIPQGVNFHGEQGVPSSEQGFRPQGGGFPPPIHRGQSSTSLEQYYGSLPYRMNAHHEQMYMPQGSGGLPYYPSMQHPMPPPPDSNPQNREMHFKHSYPPDAFPYPMHLPSRPPPGGGYLVQSPYGLHYPHPHSHPHPHPHAVPHPHPHAVPYAVHPHAALHYGGGYMNQYSMPRDVPPSVAGGSAPVQFPSQAQEGGYPLPAKEGSERQ